MITSLNKIIPFFVLLLATTNAFAQPKQLTIEDCYNLAKQNYPLIKKQALIAKSSEFSLSNASKGFFPQVYFSGQTTYQSETIHFPGELSGAGIGLPAISKEQYKIQADINQQIFDGGINKAQKMLIATNQQVEEQSIEVGLYALKDRINQIFFALLLINEQIKQNEVRKADLQGILNKAIAAFDNGTGFKSNVDELKAALISIDAGTIELKANYSGYLEMLALLIDQPLTENDQLVQPLKQVINVTINRPELKLYDMQRNILDVKEIQLKSNISPKISAFLQTGYGRPTLNIIDNKTGGWYIGGLRLDWSLGSFYTLKNDRNILKINREILNIDKETFLFNTNLALGQQNATIKKALALIEKDDLLIALRTSVMQSAKAQLDNGVITVHEYIAKVNDENLAKQARIIHNIELLQAQYNYKTTAGN